MAEKQKPGINPADILEYARGARPFSAAGAAALWRDRGPEIDPWRNYDPALAALQLKYDAMLVAKGFAEPKKAVMTLDMLDARGLLGTGRGNIKPWHLPNVGVTDLDAAYMEKYGAAAFMPCFPDGVLRINDDRYIRWSGAVLDPGTVSFRIHDYVAEDAKGTDPCWRPRLYGSVEIRDDPGGSPRVSLKDGCRTYGQLFAMLRRKQDLGWSKAQTALWNKNVMRAARDEDAAASADGGSPLENLAARFIFAVLKCNRVIADHLDARKARSGSRAEILWDAAPADGNGPETGRRTVAIGGISILSSRPPELPAQRRAPVYRTPAWERGPSVRHCKSGKIVPVKGCVNHRKCLMGAEDAAPAPRRPVTLKIKGGGDGQEEKKAE